MFIKVMFGAGSSVLVNTSCRLVNLTAHLRQKAGLLPDASLHGLPVTLALLAEDGNLVSLEEDLKEAASGALTIGSSLLKERATFVLVRIISKRERAWPPPAMSPYWRTWMTTTQSWEVSVRAQRRGRAQLLPSPYQQDFSGLPEELRRLSGLSSVGYDWRKRMGTRHGHHEQSPASRSRKMQTDSNPAGLLFQNLEMLRSCISKRARIRYTWDYLLMPLHTTLDCPRHLSCATYGADGNRAPPPHP
ncbi:uncharacterized protein C22orf15 homolog isoform X3 [Callithrix jacchus]|uniref:uncharacterized protein C22orf15 homolog isoform X3 n=1 Tax=Callithrix jacchus TaxID=9483 RepID=UPI00159D76AF|nr:uncharacterized protein C22orf15 homolog isoform X3 [Callithrix jacchus]